MMRKQQPIAMKENNCYQFLNDFIWYFMEIDLQGIIT
jgi:hypothetical protein